MAHPTPTNSASGAGSGPPLGWSQPLLRPSDVLRIAATAGCAPGDLYEEVLRLEPIGRPRVVFAVARSEALHDADRLPEWRRKSDVAIFDAVVYEFGQLGLLRSSAPTAEVDRLWRALYTLESPEFAKNSYHSRRVFAASQRAVVLARELALALGQSDLPPLRNLDEVIAQRDVQLLPSVAA